MRLSFALLKKKNVHLKRKMWILLQNTLLKEWGIGDQKKVTAVN